MKNLICATTIALMLASFVPSAQAKELMHDVKVTHLDNSAAIPNTARFQGATHKFEVHVRGETLAELAIDLPEGISLRKGIEVTNQSGEKVDAKVSVTDRKATVVFSQPVSPETTLLVSMRGVNTLGYSRTLMYRIYGKTVGAIAQIPLGTARIQTYGR
jgi:hypothetical protein